MADGLESLGWGLRNQQMGSLESLFWWGGFGNSLSSPFSTGLHQSKERREKERGDEGRTGWAPSAPWQGNTHKCQKERRSLDHDFCSPSTHTGNATQTHLQHVHRRPPSFAAPILYPGLKKKNDGDNKDGGF